MNIKYKGTNVCILLHHYKYSYELWYNLVDCIPIEMCDTILLTAYQLGWRKHNAQFNPISAGSRCDCVQTTVKFSSSNSNDMGPFSQIEAFKKLKLPICWFGPIFTPNRGILLDWSVQQWSSDPRSDWVLEWSLGHSKKKKKRRIVI